MPATLLYSGAIEKYSVSVNKLGLLERVTTGPLASGCFFLLFAKVALQELIHCNPLVAAVVVFPIIPDQWKYHTKHRCICKNILQNIPYFCIISP